MDGRSEHWLSRFWGWFLPGLAALDPGGAAYLLAETATAQCDDFDIQEKREGTAAVLRGLFRRAEARR